ncbi:hypothetical protein CCAX7_58190 [Capsulimonas corticalis]|uniref:Ice-binding protein C-terminal domain-containing protein n=1 Tax=Capsulimonas corticalis TaxID=2219043 RepID=A0A402D006_9BACT|nr:TIGR03118 family protein [Capsulimonas corticalis]BDI33768.1 hypothetical protein CCAX7_58190 [Capsulimonas corticalis]
MTLRQRIAALLVNTIIVSVAVIAIQNGAAAQHYKQTNLVTSDQSLASAAVTDPNLINPWGVSLNPAGGALWTSNNGSGKFGLYTGDVGGSPVKVAGLAPTVPGLPGFSGSPTGQVFNGSSDFKLTSGPARFITASEDGTLSAWNGNPSATATRVVNRSDFGAVYKGLAIGSNSNGNFLYASNFHSGKIDVYDGNFSSATLSGSFTDPNAPTDYAPFNLKAVGNRVYVTYAQQAIGGHEEVKGIGKGFVDVFDTNGNFVSRLATGSSLGPAGIASLDAPWGLAVAPSNFGKFSNDLLVGNFGSGQIDAFDPITGKFEGVLRDAHGKPIVIDGLWGLTFGNGVAAGDLNKLYFTAGINDEAGGLLGSIAVTSVPEPGALATFGVAGLSLIGMIARRRRSPLRHRSA